MNMNLNLNLGAQLRPVLQWWGERNLRERLLVLASGAAVVLVAGDALFATPVERRLKQARIAVQTQQAKVDAAHAANAPGQSAQSQRDQARELQKRVQRAQAAASVLRRQATEAARLPETLRAITATVGSARLLALDFAGDSATPPAAASSAAGQPAATALAAQLAGQLAPQGTGSTAPASATRLYRLPITLKVSGTYDELHMLLTQIERHAEALQWSSITLDNTEWPAIQLTLKAHVLSPDPRWGAAS
jgi:hypothetical protein